MGKEMPKYKLEDNLHIPTALAGDLAGLAGLGLTVYALVTQDQETAIVGGALFAGGALTSGAEYMKAYLKTKVQYMNDRPNKE